MANYTPLGVEATIKGLSGFNRGLKDMQSGITKTGDTADKAGGRFSGLGKKVAALGATMAKVAVAGVAAVGAGVIAAGGYALRAASDFESAFAGIEKTVNGLDEVVAGTTKTWREFLQQGVRQLALEVPLAVEELAAIGEIGGQLGVPKEALIDFTETVAALGVSTNLATDEAALALARVSNIFNVSAEDMAANVRSLGNAIVALGNNFAANESEIAAYSLRLAGAGRIAGLTQGDILGIGAAMSAIGVPAERGGTAVQKVLLAMNDAAAASAQGFVDHSEAIEANEQKALDLTAKLKTLEAQTGVLGQELWNEYEAFIAAGGSAAQFGEQLGDTRRAQLFKTIRSIQELNDETATLRDQQGKPISDELLGTFARLSGRTVEDFKEDWQEDAPAVFRDFVRGLELEGDNAVGVLEELELGDQRLISALLSLTGAQDQLADAMALANEEFDGGNALAIEAEKRYATFKSQVRLLKNSLRDLAIIAGQPLLEFFAELIKKIKPHIDAFGQRLPAAIEEFKKAMGEGGVIGVLKLAGEKFAILAGIIKDKIIEAWPGIRDALLTWAANFWNWLTGPDGAISRARDQILAFVGSVISALVQNWPAIQATLMAWANVFWDWLTGPDGAISQAVDRILMIVNTIATTFTENWPIIQDTLMTWASLFWTWLTGEDGVINQVVDRVVPVINAIATTLTENWPIIRDQLLTWSSMFWDWLAGEDGVIGQVADQVIPAVVAIANAFAENWPAIRDQLLEWATLFWDWLTGEGGVLQTAGEIIQPALEQIGQVIAENWPIIRDQLMVWASQFWGWLTGPGGALDQAGEELDKIAASFDTWADDNEDFFISLGEKIADGILAGIVVLVGSISFGNAVNKAMGEGINSVADTFKKIGQDIATGIITGLFEGLTGIEIPDVVLEGIKNSMSKIFEVTPLAGPAGFLNLFTTSLDAIKTLITEVKDLLPKLGDAFTSLTLPEWLTPGSPTPLETALAAIGNFLGVILPERMTTFSTIFVEKMVPIQQATQAWKDLLLQIADVTLPHLQEVVISTTSVIIERFNSVKPTLIEVNSLISEMAALLEEVAEAAAAAAKAMIDEFDKAIDKITSDGGLIDALEDLVKILESVKAAAEAAAKAVGSIGSSNPTQQGGGGFQHGADFIVPPGHPRDTFPMRVSSGERVIVIPKSQVDGSAAGGTMNLGPITVQDPIDLAVLEATIERVVARKFG